MEPDSASPSPNENIQPVRFLKTDDRLAHPAPGVALCLSGGGYRAMGFHLGTLWRLNDAGLLRKCNSSSMAPVPEPVGRQWRKAISSSLTSRISDSLVGK